MKKQFAETILELKLLADRMAEGVGENAGLFSVKYQILFLVSKNRGCSPKELIERLNLAKSNLALACNSLVEEGLLEKRKDDGNKKEVFYYITKNGEKELDERMQPIELIYESAKKPKEVFLKIAKIDEILKSI